MAITQTPRLALQKQSAGDPNWNAALDAGMDNADARFATYGPVATAVGYYLGQLHVDPAFSPPKLSICTAIGSPGTFVSISQLSFGFNGISGNLVLNNNIFLKGKDTGAVNRNLAGVSSTDIVQLGDVNLPTTIFANAVSALKVNYGAGDKIVWHEANDGTGSGLDADLLDGLSSLDFLSYQAGVYFESAEQTPTLSASTGATFVHPFGTRPRLYFVYYRAASAEHGYAANEEIQLHSMNEGGANPRGLTISADINNVYVNWKSVDAFRIMPKGGGSPVDPTSAIWRMRVRAWK